MTERPPLTREGIEEECRLLATAGLAHDIERIKEAIRTEMTYEREHQMLLASGGTKCYFALYVVTKHSDKAIGEALRLDAEHVAYRSAICDSSYVWQLDRLGKGLFVTVSPRQSDPPLDVAGTERREPSILPPMSSKEPVCVLL